MKRKIILIVVLSLLSFIGCQKLQPDSNVTPIGKIVSDPRTFDGKIVEVKGVAGKTFSAILIKYFELTDDTGTIHVVTTRPLPQRGAEVRVKGVVNASFSILSQDLIVIIEGEEGKNEP